MEDELVTVRSYRDLPEAQMAKAKLEDEGLECFLTDENMAALVGDMKLQVAAKDLEAASAFLSEEIPESFSAEEIGEEFHQPKCPQCGSLNVFYTNVDMDHDLSKVHPSSLPLASHPEDCRVCNDCGTLWVDLEDEATR